MLMHNIVPHTHNDSLHLSEHEISKKPTLEFLDMLEALFHVDMGEDHLENFKSANGFDFDLKFDIQIPCANNFCFLSKIIENKTTDAFELHEFPDVIPLSLKIFTSSLDLRGPPSFS